MIGIIDEFRRALLSVLLRSSPDEFPERLDVWIDTGFTGELVLPHRVIESLRLTKSGSVDAILADGSGIELSTFTCFIDWFDMKRRVEVVENEGDRALGDEKRTNSISFRDATSTEQGCSLVFRIRSVFPVCHQVSRGDVTIFHPCT